MNLLQVMLSPGEGGAETYFEKLSEAFQRESLAQALFIGDVPRRRERLLKAGCQVETIPSSGLAKFLLPWRVARRARPLAPDICLGWMNRSCAVLPRLPGCVNVGRLGGYYKLKNYTRCDHLVANTPDIRDWILKQDAGWTDDRVHFIPNFGTLPPPTGRSVRDELGLPAGRPVLLSLGRLHPSKAQDVLLRALPAIPDAIVLFAGAGDSEAEYRQLAAELGVADRVRFLGWRSDTADLFAAADLCVFPSRIEPFGNVVVEAWAAGRPIVAAASSGPGWLIRDAGDGLLVPVEDHEGLAAAVNRALGDAALRERMVRNGAARLAEEFSEKAVVARWLDLFARIRA